MRSGAPAICTQHWELYLFLKIIKNWENVTYNFSWKINLFSMLKKMIFYSIEIFFSLFKQWGSFVIHHFEVATLFRLKCRQKRGKLSRAIYKAYLGKFPYNFSIFLLLRFYVKSIFEILEVLKMPFNVILETLNFDFLVNFSLHIVQKIIEIKSKSL